MTLWFENKHKLSQKLAFPSPSDRIVYVLAKRQAFNDSIQSCCNVYLIVEKIRKCLVSGYPTHPNTLVSTQTFLKTLWILMSMFRL